MDNFDAAFAFCTETMLLTRHYEGGAAIISNPRPGQLDSAICSQAKIRPVELYIDFHLLWKYISLVLIDG